MTPDRHDHFCGTDAVRADLRGHSVRSGFIAIGARTAQAMLQLVGVVVLARILTPAAVPEALLKRQMRFGLVMAAHVIGLVIATTAAIASALAGVADWALLIQVASPPALRGMVVWMMSGWRPSRALKATRQSAALGADGRENDVGAGVVAMRRYWAGPAGFRFVSWAGDHLDPGCWSATLAPRRRWATTTARGAEAGIHSPS